MFEICERGCLKFVKWGAFEISERGGCLRLVKGGVFEISERGCLR